MQTTRREFLASTLMATLAAPNVFSASRYRVGITTNTRGGWENDVWLSFREAREAGHITMAGIDPVELTRIVRRKRARG